MYDLRPNGDGLVGRLARLKGLYSYHIFIRSANKSDGVEVTQKKAAKCLRRILLQGCISYALFTFCGGGCLCAYVVLGIDEPVWSIF